MLSNLGLLVIVSVMLVQAATNNRRQLALQSAFQEYRRDRLTKGLTINHYDQAMYQAELVTFQKLYNKPASSSTNEETLLAFADEFDSLERVRARNLEYGFSFQVEANKMILFNMSEKFALKNSFIPLNPDVIAFGRRRADEISNCAQGNCASSKVVHAPIDDDGGVGLSFFVRTLHQEEEMSHRGGRSAQSLPSSVNWTPMLTNVKEQGTCGGCWSFATTGLLESLYAIMTNGTIISLSEEQLLDCDTSVNQGCSGGNYYHALQDYTSSQGMATEKTYPYASIATSAAHASSCLVESDVASVILSAPQVSFVSSNENSIIQALQSGPVAIAIAAYNPTFQYYSGGIINDVNGCGLQIDHAALLVGYGFDESLQQEYWLVKNSWGVAWGENGYARLIKGDASVLQQSNGLGICGMYSQINTISWTQCMLSEPSKCAVLTNPEFCTTTEGCVSATYEFPGYSNSPGATSNNFWSLLTAGPWYSSISFIIGISLAIIVILVVIAGVFCCTRYCRRDSSNKSTLEDARPYGLNNVIILRELREIFPGLFTDELLLTIYYGEGGQDIGRTIDRLLELSRPPQQPQSKQHRPRSASMDETSPRMKLDSTDPQQRRSSRHSSLGTTNGPRKDAGPHQVRKDPGPVQQQQQPQQRSQFLGTPPFTRPGTSSSTTATPSPSSKTNVPPASSSPDRSRPSQPSASLERPAHPTQQPLLPPVQRPDGRASSLSSSSNSSGGRSAARIVLQGDYGMTMGNNPVDYQNTFDIPDTLSFNQQRQVKSVRTRSSIQPQQQQPQPQPSPSQVSSTSPMRSSPIRQPAFDSPSSYYSTRESPIRQNHSPSSLYGEQQQLHYQSSPSMSSRSLSPMKSSGISPTKILNPSEFSSCNNPPKQQGTGGQPPVRNWNDYDML